MGQSSVSNMQFPTEAWQSANQSANNMYLQGKKALAEGVTSAAGGISSYFKQQKQIKIGNDAAIKFMESPQGSAMLKLKPEQTKMFKEAVSNMGTNERAQYIHMFLQQALANQGQQWKLEQDEAAAAAHTTGQLAIEKYKASKVVPVTPDEPFTRW